MARRSEAWWGAALAAAGVLALAGCGGVDESGLPGGGSGATGRTCYQDADCVPDGCCGQATTAIHVQDAPSCAGVTCSGSCPVNMIDCGCGLPVCHDGQCTVARTVDERCQ